MEFKGRYSIPAAPDAVWAALHDEAVLQQAIPGCEAVEKISDTVFKARAMVKIGPVKARFEGRVELNALTPETGFTHALTLKGEGQGGAAGFARGESQVRLAREGSGTILQYDARRRQRAACTIGQRLIDGAAKLADEFFANHQRHAASDGTAGVPATKAPREEGLGPQIWSWG
jgi:carbon monoxide dehydrogenase subunit G